MQIRVCYFAVLRELAGQTEETLDVPEGTTVAALFDQRFPPEERPRLRAPMMFAVNQSYERGDHVLAEGDEVAFIPPVSGGVDEDPRALPWCELREGPIDLAELVAAVSSTRHGAITTFTGVVRDHAEGRSVRGLLYEAYKPMAEAQMRAVAEEIAERWGVRAVAMVHRVGELSLGDVAVAIAVGTGHRREGFEACSYAIDRLKETVPIWKKEFYDDVQATWK